MSGRLFDAYLMVDWSGASSPVLGKDSIWTCLLADDGMALANHPTRDAATRAIADLLADALEAGKRVLAGFDFSFGYAEGLAERLGAPDWRTVWRFLADRIEDAPDNRNNRFALAAGINRDSFAGAGPFWGCPAAAESPHLPCRRPVSTMPRRRLVERRLPTAKSAFQLHYNGAVGSQALVGIPRVWSLRNHPRLAAAARIWPFETGLAAPADTRLVLAEIYPSMVAPDPLPGRPRDAGQVSAIARHYADADRAGLLAGWFAGDPTLGAAERATVEREEGWVLGVTALQPPRRAAPAAPYPYLRDPAAIYRESWRLVQAATDLSGLPPDLHAIAIRLVHTTADPAIVGWLRAAPGAVAAAQAALRAGGAILVDAEMVAAGITRTRLPAGNAVVCTLNDPAVPALAADLATTRSAAALQLWSARLGGAVVAIGNAPTALFRLLELIEAGAPRPAVVLGFCVGFVGAAEAKEALMASGLPWIALAGRRGGSALAAAAVNALAGEQP